ncbi:MULTISPECIES: GLPGLI family protein [unclassified Flavobacterium]|uniref:GLPGLI family protein n=1 Tax=unclassified Flavobacterium TaxID=196869 RepID=UPI000C18C9C5|nr:MULTISPECIES: GLPGLI family protein [unclassified Flavobacterium]PIF61967.1 GLPGLI family protein [Flavobacterium sp. 11]WKL43127.1 GLPGLI family protein [Flavobacterium sp. ZE23DGlu08]
MKNHFILFFVFCSVFSALAQKNIKSIKITYTRSSNGTLIENQDPILVFTNELKTQITSESIFNKKASYPFEYYNIYRENNRYDQFANLNENKIIYTTDSLSLAKQNFEITNETKTILGYACKKAKTVINSNTIELWFTNDLKVKGAPTILGQNLGLVLEMVRNGNYITAATKIEVLKEFPIIRKSETPQRKVDLLTYKDLIWKSRFTNIAVFDKEIINFSNTSQSNDSILRFANGTIILKKVKIPEIKKGNRIFVDVTEQSNGDAYDRTGSVFLIPTDKNISFLDGLKNGVKTLPIYENGNGEKYQGVIRTENYAPLLELMRFFTPFGVKQFNTLQLKNKVWQDSVYYRQDISEMLPALSNKEVWIGMNIGNYDKGGHKASLNISIHPEEENKPKNTWLLPLFNTNNVMEMAGQQYATMFNTDKGLEVTFDVPEGFKNFKLRYITTGHGGWENGDEFVPKKNTILVDEKEVFAFTPWRTDCGSYRLSNPASGNFSDGLSSSDLSRSNWCPGTVTNPIYIDLGNLSPGKHTIQIKIPQGKPEGSSFSSWNVSGCLIGE